MTPEDEARTAARLEALHAAVVALGDLVERVTALLALAHEIEADRQKAVDGDTSPK